MTPAPMTPLDEHEWLTLSRFIHLLETEELEERSQVDYGAVARRPEGQIVVPIVIDGEEPSLHLALLMSRKAEQIYKQTGCRLIIAQRPSGDPTNRAYVWIDDRWQPLT